MKIYLIIFLSLFAPLVSFAAYNDVTMSGSAIINVADINLVVVGGANLSSITVNASNFTIDLSENSSLVVTSVDRRNFTVSPSGYTQSQSCDTNTSVLAVSNSTASTVTFTITPLTTTCTVGITSSSDTTTSSNSGGGGSGSAPSVPAQTTKPAVIAQAPAVTTPTLPAPSITVPSVSPVFTKVLKVGSAGSDIKRLQQLLNSDPDTAVAKSGVGSPGKETATFGSLTKEAVKKFQCKYSVVCSGDESTTGYGLLGPKTRAKVAEVFGSQAAVQQPSAPTQPVPAASQTAVSNIQSQIQILLQKIQELQTKLNAM